MVTEPYRLPAERPAVPDATPAVSKPIAAPQQKESDDGTDGIWLVQPERREPEFDRRNLWLAVVVLLLTTLFVFLGSLTGTR